MNEPTYTAAQYDRLMHSLVMTRMDVITLRARVRELEAGQGEDDRPCCARCNHQKDAHWGLPTGCAYCEGFSNFEADS